MLIRRGSLAGKLQRCRSDDSHGKQSTRWMQTLLRVVAGFAGAHGVLTPGENFFSRIRHLNVFPTPTAVPTSAIVACSAKRGHVRTWCKKYALPSSPPTTYHQTPNTQHPRTSTSCSTAKHTNATAIAMTKSGANAVLGFATCALCWTKHCPQQAHD